jgi:beta-carotene 3-hydroxylase
MEGLFTAIGSFVLMEVISWAMHKYLMHGPLWRIHKTHHVHGKGFFELNDLFSLFFGSIAVALIVLGLEHNNPYALGAGIGVSVYGLTYFVLHDVLIHRRIKALGRFQNPYLKALADAHRDHHRTRERDGAVVFGLLWVPIRYFRKQNRKGRIA